MSFLESNDLGIKRFHAKKGSLQLHLFQMMYGLRATSHGSQGFVIVFSCVPTKYKGVTS